MFGFFLFFFWQSELSILIFCLLFVMTISNYIAKHIMFVFVFVFVFGMGDVGGDSEGSNGNTSDNGLWFIVGGAVALLILVVIAVLYVKRSTHKNGPFRNVNVRQEMIPTDED